MNLSGLASGLDTNSIVDQLMAIERRPQARIKLQQRQVQARQDALRDVSTRLKNLENAARELRSAGVWADVQSLDTTDASRVAVRRVGAAPPGGAHIEVTRLARAEQRTYTYTPQDDDAAITIGDLSVPVPANSSLSAVVAAINSAPGSPVYALAVTDPTSGQQQLTLASRTTGQGSGFTATGAALTEVVPKYVGGLDATYKLNGEERTSPANVVTDAIPGLELTLKGLTGATPVTVNVGAPHPDFDAIRTKVRALVDQYNSTVDFINGKLTDKRVPNAKTEADAIKGVLYGDSGLRTILKQLRDTLSTPSSGQPAAGLSTLADIGVSTGAASGGSGLNRDAIRGRLTLDNEKLSTALDANFTAVRNLLRGSDGNGGFSRQVEDLIHPSTQTAGTLDSRITAEDSAKRRLTDSFAELDRRLKSKETALKQQFSIMEKALSQSQSIGQRLSGQITSLNQRGR